MKKKLDKMTAKELLTILAEVVEKQGDMSDIKFEFDESNRELLFKILRPNYWNQERSKDILSLKALFWNLDPDHDEFDLDEKLGNGNVSVGKIVGETIDKASKEEMKLWFRRFFELI